jgi:malate dehydrogenase (oxaloacetate-decarboxylating)
VFQDDHHGTAVVVLAALINALTLTSRRIEDVHVVIIGLGAAGIAVTRILMAAGVRGANVVGCDSRGALHSERADYLDGSMDQVKRALAENTNLEKRSGSPRTCSKAPTC